MNTPDLSQNEAKTLILIQKYMPPTLVLSNGNHIETIVLVIF